MFEGHPHILFDLLLAQSAISPPALRTAFSEHEATGGSFAKLLFDSGLIDQPTLLRTVAKHIGSDYVERPPATIPAEIVALVSATIARSHQVMPVGKNGSVLTLLAVELLIRISRKTSLLP